MEGMLPIGPGPPGGQMALNLQPNLNFKESFKNIFTAQHFIFKKSLTYCS